MAESIQLASVVQHKLSELFDTKGNEKQEQAFAALRKYKFILYGGAAGGGKSWWLRWACVRFLLRMYFVFGIKKAVVGLFCEDYPTLRDRQIVKIAQEFPKWLGELKEFRDVGLAFRLHDRFGGGSILLRNLDDPSKYNSSEFCLIAVDELTRNTLDTFDELRKRLRWPVRPCCPECKTPDAVPDEELEDYLCSNCARRFVMLLPFIGGTNPGEIGHDWVKGLWIDSIFPEELKRFAPLFKFIQAKSKDNKMNPPGYFSDLMSLPDDLRAAYADGDWNRFKGQFFGEWRREFHVCEPFHVPSHWKKFVASDWGYAATAPWIVLWFAVDPMGKIYVYRELAKPGMTPQAMMIEVSKLSEGESYSYALLDPACWDSSRGVSIGDQCLNAGFGWSKADNDRTSGWSRVREYMAWKKDERGNLIRKPKLQVFSNCTMTIKTVPACPFDKIKVNDLDTKSNDHCADTLRYGLMSMPGISTVPMEELPKDYFEADMRARERERKNNSSNYGDLS